MSSLREGVLRLVFDDKYMLIIWVTIPNCYVKRTKEREKNDYDLNVGIELFLVP